MSQGTVYYKQNVKYPIGVRMDIMDSIGRLLTLSDPYVAIPSDRLRDFKVANKRAILEGLIVEASEPSVDWETPNALTEDDMKGLVSGPFIKLKNALPEISSTPIVSQMLEFAKELNRPEKTIKLIQDRYDELVEDEEDFVNKRGVE